MTTMLCVAVHPDDETLGCGGTLLKYAAMGASLHWVLVTAAHRPEFSPEQIAQQAEQVWLVEKAYPFVMLHWLKLPTTRLETLPVNQLVGALRQVIEEVRPEVVFVPNRSDAHSDHRVVFHVMLSILKSFYMSSLGVQRVLACDTISETEAAPPLPEYAFLPTTFVDVSTTFERKLEIMHLYQTEVHDEPFPRSPTAIRAQARYRGATIGVTYAEAFMLIREVL